MLLAVFNDGAMIALSKDRVEASATPDQWNLAGIFTTGIVYGLYLTLSTWALYFTATHTQVPCVQALLPDVCSWRPQPTVRTVVHCGFGALPLSLRTFFNQPTSVRAWLTAAAPAWCAFATMRVQRWAVLRFQCGPGSLLTVAPAFQSCRGHSIKCCQLCSLLSIWCCLAAVLPRQVPHLLSEHAGQGAQCLLLQLHQLSGLQPH